ncbi:MAG TPA: DEAD/DEAH box helicase family protein [Bacteroidales bacterium]|nr:DEAD/DEAH box helicase family protein [Bacteroidales bacterium]
MNQTPEEIARDKIDQALKECGWVVQDKKGINLNAATGVAVREYLTDIGPADYVLFVNKKPVGIIEAKREEEGIHLTTHEEQSREYAESKLKYLNNDPIPYVYESTGSITRFTDYRDPKPRSRPLFSFHKPETFIEWQRRDSTLRARLHNLPVLPSKGLRDCQFKAINNLEKSFRENRDRALIQMATGSGKTFTAITSAYRLLKFADAKRILFLVDTRNLGEQAEQEFMAYTPVDDNRKFTELYNVQRLRGSYIASDSQVCISTIQRLYSVLKGEELDESAEETNPAETSWQNREPQPVVYTPRLPVEFFDFIIIDECHRSIYNLWRQVLEYFDAFQIGLTATPDTRTFGYFRQNVVSEYTHQQAVTDGVNVGYDVYLIESEITKKGSSIWKGEFVDFREKLSRKKRWAQLDEEIKYSAKKLDDEVVNPNQIRSIIKAFRDHLPEMFGDRITANGEFEVPKTLIFAKTDSHADDIIQIVREEFNESNHFCKKLTYRTEDPKSVLAQFRNDYYPRIAVTVDMVATGTDVKPLELLLFMRDVKSRNYFEQMKGRGTRTISLDDLRKVSPSAKFAKDHFVIVDAIGVTKSLKTESSPLERKPGVPLKDLLYAVAVGVRDEDLYLSLANRLVRLESRITEHEKTLISEKSGGASLSQMAIGLLKAYDTDTLEEIQHNISVELQGKSQDEIDKVISQQISTVIEDAALPFTGDLNILIDNIRKAHEQIIDEVNRDKILFAGWSKDNIAVAQGLVDDFKRWITEHKNEIEALQIFYDQPFRRKDITFRMIRDLAETIVADRPLLAPLHVWKAYEHLEKAAGNPKNEITALVSLLRRIIGIDKELTSFDLTIDRNFREWIFRKQAGPVKFNEEQMSWLRMIKEHIAASVHIDYDDLDFTPFDAGGGKGKMWQLFGEDSERIIAEMNEFLAA